MVILCFAVVSFVSVVSVVSKKTLPSARPNFLSEGVRLGLDKEIAPDGTYLAYFPFGAMIERSRMTPYHKKLLSCTLNSRKPYKSNNHSDMPCSPDHTVDSDPYLVYHP